MGDSAINKDGLGGHMIGSVHPSLSVVTIHATMQSMTDETFAEYLPGIRSRWRAEQQGWQLRRERAWAHARDAAEVLRRFGATRVFAFGSLARTGVFDARSDIDLAEEGIRDEEFWRAYAEAAEAAGDFELDVVDVIHCPPELCAVILREGVPL